MLPSNNSKRLHRNKLPPDQTIQTIANSINSSNRSRVAEVEGATNRNMESMVAKGVTITTITTIMVTIATMTVGTSCLIMTGRSCMRGEPAIKLAQMRLCSRIMQWMIIIKTTSITHRHVTSIITTITEITATTITVAITSITPSRRLVGTKVEVVCSAILNRMWLRLSSRCLKISRLSGIIWAIR